MALSGTYYGPWLGSGYQRVYVTWSATQNVAANTSTITASLVWDNSSGYALSSNVAKSASVSIGGVVAGSTTSAVVGIAGKTIRTIVTGSRTVNHNSDGTLSVAISGTFGIKFTLGGTYYASTSASGTATLDTIPRTSIISSFPNFTIGSGVTVTAPRNSSSFTNEYHIYVGTKVIYSSSKVSADSFTFTGGNLDGIYAQIPNASSVTVTAYVNTYSGTTLIGQSSKTATASVGSGIIPTFTSVTATETVAALSGMMTAGHYLQNYSRIKFTINGAAGAKKSDIASYKITFNGGTYGQNGTTGLINATGEITATATVTDTRGRTSASKTVKCILVAFPSNIGSFGNFNIGSGVSASKTKPSNSNLQTKFVLTASGKNAGGTTTSFSKTIGPGTADSATFTASDTSALYTITAEATSITVTLTATTHGANGAVIDTKTKTATASVESTIKPNTSGLALTSLEQNTITSNLALGANTFVQNKSTIKFTAAGGSGGTGTKAALTYSINFNGVNYANASTTGVHNVSGTNAARVTITDSRGRTNYKDFNLTFLPYTAPSITRFTGTRRELAADIVDITSQATISKLNNKNQLSYQISSRIKGGAWVVKTPWVSLAVGESPLSSTPAYEEYDPTTSYDFLLEVKDKYNTVYSAIFPVGTEQVTMSWGKFGIGVGKVHEDGALDVKGDSFLDGDLNLTGRLVAKSGMYIPDTRSIVSIPEELPKNSLTVDFKANASVGSPPLTASSSYSHILNVAGWNTNEGSGGWPSQLSVGDGIAVRQATGATSWGPWRNMWHSGNFNPASYSLTSHTHSYLPLSGGTLTGSLTLPGSIVLAKDSGYSALRISNPNGYLQVGPLNTSVCHLYTDRPSFYFNKALMVNGTYVSMDGHTHSYLPLSGGTITGSITRTSDFASATAPQMVGVIFGTGNPPTASTVPRGTIYLKYV